MRILTNNPKKIIGLEGYGLRVTDQIPIEHQPNAHNRDYLRTKRDRMGHDLPGLGDSSPVQALDADASPDQGPATP
jgi:3,4-dihydroxy 2-butanone 4-phosphate synthase/GTP cyclohydrolase II